jgi:hypothetical protein
VRINTVLGNLKTNLKGTYHLFPFRKYATRYMWAFAYRFNRRCDLRTLNTRLPVAASCYQLIQSARSGGLALLVNQARL